MGAVKTIICVCLLTFVMPACADDMPEINNQEQQDAQKSCEQLRFEHCIAKCDINSGQDCTDQCSQNAKNECLEAGE